MRLFVHGLWQLASELWKLELVFDIVTLINHFCLSFSSTVIVVVSDWKGCGMAVGEVSFSWKELAFVPHDQCKYLSKFVSFHWEELICLTPDPICHLLLPHLTSWQLWQIYLIVVWLGRHFFAYCRPFELYLIFYSVHKTNNFCVKLQTQKIKSL